MHQHKCAMPLFLRYSNNFCYCFFFGGEGFEKIELAPAGDQESL